MNDNRLSITVHELEEGRRYASLRIGEGYDLMILTTPISEACVEEHESLMQRKVDEEMRLRDCRAASCLAADDLAMTMNEGNSE